MKIEIIIEEGQRKDLLFIRVLNILRRKNESTRMTENSKEKMIINETFGIKQKVTELLKAE